MKRLSTALPTLLLIAAFASCTRADENTPRSDTAAERPVCLQGERWTSSGPIPVESAPGDAAEVVGLRWNDHSGCERLVIDLGTADRRDATGAGHLRAEFLRDLGVVRISLLDVPSVRTGATEIIVDGTLARGAYSVWSPEGRWTFVDVHLRDNAEARVTSLGSPARVVVDLRPGQGPLLVSPATSDRVVVLQPRAGDAGYPLEVVGYARTFEANVVARLVQDGQQVHESFTTATAWVDAWGHFSLTIPDGPRGRVTLQVGECSAKDGTWDGAAVELTMR